MVDSAKLICNKFNSQQAHFWLNWWRYIKGLLARKLINYWIYRDRFIKSSSHSVKFTDFIPKVFQWHEMGRRYRSSHQKCSKACNFIKKRTLAPEFSSEFCEIFKNNFFTEHLRTTASEGTNTISTASYLKTVKFYATLFYIKERTKFENFIVLLLSYRVKN